MVFARRGLNRRCYGPGPGSQLRNGRQPVLARGDRLRYWFTSSSKNARMPVAREAKHLASKIHSLPICTGREMHISISAIAVTEGSILKIAAHRECQASVTRQVLCRLHDRCTRTVKSGLDSRRQPCRMVPAHSMYSPARRS